MKLRIRFVLLALILGLILGARPWHAALASGAPPDTANDGGLRTDSDRWSFTTSSADGNHPPDIPVNVSPLSGTSDMGLAPTLSWTGHDPDGDPLTYSVLLSENQPNSGDWACYNIAATTCKLGILDSNSTYYWSVYASDGVTQVQGDTWSFHTHTPGPGTANLPTNPLPPNGATNIGPTQQLSWTDTDPDGDPLYYWVYFGDVVGSLDLISCADAGKAACDPGPLLPSTTYYWYVVPTDGGRPPSDGWVWHFTTGPGSGQPPAAPTQLSVAQTDLASIALTWQDNSSDEASFRVERSATGTGAWTEVASTTTNGAAFTDTGLTCSTQYFYRVRARNANGNSAYSNTVNATTVDCSVGIPAAPSGVLAFKYNQAYMMVSWISNSSNATSFKVERSPNGSTGWSEVYVGAGNTNFFVDTTVTCNTQYFYRVRAGNAFGNSAYSNTANDTTYACPAPAAPSGLNAGPAGPTSVTLGWQDNSSGEDSFHVERSPDGSTGWTEVGTANANATAFSDTGLTCATPYFYRVRAHSAAGYSTYSNTASANTNACPTIPAAPSSLSGKAAGPTSIKLTWADNSPDEDSFRVERSADGLAGWAEVGAANANATALTDSGLRCQTVYFYRVRARNLAGDSDYSSPAGASSGACPLSKTLKAPVIIGPKTNLLTKNATPALTWKPVAGATRYQVEIAADAKFSHIQQNVMVSSAAFTPVPLADGVHYWRVAAANATGVSKWAAARKLTVDTKPLAPPTLKSPLNGSNITLKTAKLVIVKPGGAVRFEYQISVDVAFGTTLRDVTITATSLSLSKYPLTPGITYYWRAADFDLAGNISRWSTVGSFIIH